MTVRLTREQLYDLVWSEPMQRLAKKIGISDVAIAKHCRKLGVPVPERGYWNKLHAGQSVSKTELPPRDLVTMNCVEMQGSLGPELCARIQGEPGVACETSGSIDVLAGRFRARLGKVLVPRSLANPHPEIAKLLRKDEKRRQNHTQSPYSWNEPRFESAFERRRLRLLNGLLLAFERVGGSGYTRGDDAREIAIAMGNASVGFQLDAVRTKNVRRGTSPPDDKARFFLSVNLHARTVPVTTRWEDKKGEPLEDQLADIIVGMAVAGEHMHRQWVMEQEAWRKKRQEEEEREARRRKAEEERRERERLAAQEKAKRDALLANARAWRDADTIRAYVTAAQQAAAVRSDMDAMGGWAAWAVGEADRLDPIVNGAAYEEARKGSEEDAGT
jgi:hypothetical protein